MPGIRSVHSLWRTCRPVAVAERQPEEPDHRSDALAWRHSLWKFDVHTATFRADATARASFEAHLPLPVLDRALSGSRRFGYPIPKAPEALQIFIDRMTPPYFRFFAIAILITMLLKDSTIAWFRLKDGYKQAITTIKLKIAPGLFAALFLYGGVALASHYIFNVRDSFGAFCQPDPKAKELDICRPSNWLYASEIPAATFRPLARPSVGALKPNSIPVIPAPRQAQGGAASALQIRDQQEGRLVISGSAVGPGRNAA